MNIRYSNLPWIYLSSIVIESASACATSGLGRQELGSEHYNHLIKVLRSRPGDKLIAVCLSSGRGYLSVIKSVDRGSRSLEVEIQEDTRLESPYPPVRCLILALLKGKRTEYAIEKATELGVREVVLFEAERSVVRISSASESGDKIKRFRLIAESAAAQSRKLFHPEIMLASSPEQLFEQIDSFNIGLNSRLSCSLSDAAVPIDRLSSVSQAPLAMAIGPEGDFSTSEERLFQEHGFQLVQLSPYVLRSDTAVVCALSMAQALWGRS